MQEPLKRGSISLKKKQETKDGIFFPPYPGWHGISHQAENDTPTTPAQEHPGDGEGVEQMNRKRPPQAKRRPGNTPY